MGARRRRVFVLLLFLGGLFALPALPKAAAVFECPEIGFEQDDVQSYTCAGGAAAAANIVGTTAVGTVRMPFDCVVKMSAGAEATDHRVGNTTVKHYEFEWTGAVACGLPSPSRLEVYVNKVVKGTTTFGEPVRSCNDCSTLTSDGQRTCTSGRACRGLWTHNVGIRIHTAFPQLVAAHGDGFSCDSSSGSYIQCTGETTFRV